jgi:hypothetical protein
VHHWSLMSGLALQTGGERSKQRGHLPAAAPPEGAGTVTAVPISWKSVCIDAALAL